MAEVTDPRRLTEISVANLGLEHINDRVKVNGSAGHLLGWRPAGDGERIAVLLTPQQNPRVVEALPEDIVTILDADEIRKKVGHWGIGEGAA